MSTITFEHALQAICRAIEAARCTVILDAIYDETALICAAPNGNDEYWEVDIRLTVDDDRIRVTLERIRETLEHFGPWGSIDRAADECGLDAVCHWLTSELSYI